MPTTIAWILLTLLAFFASEIIMAPLNIAEITGDGGRHVRSADDDFTTFHKRMTQTARVFSGISLRIGLHDGSIPADEALAELLNLDPSVKLEDLEKFDAARLKNFIEKLTAVALTESKPEVGALEKTLMTLESWRQKFVKIADPKDGSSLDNFVKEVEKLNASDVKLPSNNIQAIKSGIKIFKERENNEADVVLPQITSLKTLLGKLAKLPEQVDAYLKSLMSHQPVLLNHLPSTSAYQMVQLVINYFSPNNHISQQGLSTNTELNNFFVALAALSPDFDAAKKELTSLMGLLSSRTSSVMGPKVHTSGFVHGHADLSTLTSDASDGWMTTAIPKYDGPLISRELQPIHQLHSKMAAVENMWNVLDDRQKSKAIEKLSIVLKNFENVKTTSTSGDQKMQATQQIQNLVGTNGFQEKPQEMIKHIRVYQDEFVKLLGKFSMLAKMDSFKNLKQLCEFGDLIKFTDKNEDNRLAELPAVLNSMASFTRLPELENALNELDPILTDLLASTKDFSTRAGPIIGNATVFSDFFANPMLDTIIDHMKSISTSSDDVKALAEGVEMVWTVREIKKDSNFMANLTEVMQIVQSSATQVKELREIPKTMKDTSTPGMETLVQLKGIQSEMQTFGEAVKVVDDVEKTLEAKTSIEKFMDGGWKVLEEAKALSDKTKKAEVVGSWDDFGNILLKFDSLLQDVEELKGKLAPSGQSLVEYAQLFTHFQSLKSIDVNFEDKLKALDTLSQANPTGVAVALKPDVKKLESLELSFASHQTALGSAAGACQSVVGWFASFGPPHATTAKAPTDDNRNDGNNRNQDDLMPKELDPVAGALTEEDNTTRNACIVVGSVIGFFGVVGVGVFLYRKYSKDTPKGTENNSNKNNTTDPKKEKTPSSTSESDSAQDKPGEKKKEEPKPQPQQPQPQPQSSGPSNISEMPMSADEKKEEVKPPAAAAPNSQNPTNPSTLSRKAIETENSAMKEDLMKIRIQAADLRIQQIGLEEHPQDLDNRLSVITSQFKAMCGSYHTQLTRVTLNKWKNLNSIWTPVIFDVSPFECEAYHFLLRMQWRAPTAVIVKRNKTATISLIPSKIKFDDAMQSFKKSLKDNELTVNKQFQFTAVRTLTENTILCFDQTRVRLSNGKFVDANDYRVGYGSVGILASAPLNGNIIEFLTMVVEKKVKNVWSFNDKFRQFVYYPKKVEDGPKKFGKFKVSLVKNSTVFVEGHVDLFEIKIEYKGKTYLLKQYDMYSWDSDLPLDEGFRNAFLAVIEVTRRRACEQLLVYDTNGVYRAAVAIAPEFMCAAATQNGCLAFDKKELWTPFICVRGNVLKRYDHVLFAETMAMILMSETVPSYQKDRILQKQLEILLNCNSKEYDMTQKISIYGAQEAEGMKMEKVTGTVTCSIAIKFNGHPRKEDDMLQEEPTQPPTEGELRTGEECSLDVTQRGLSTKK